MMFLNSLSEPLLCWLVLVEPSALLFRLPELAGLLPVRFFCDPAGLIELKFGGDHIVRNYLSGAVWWLGSLMRFSFGAGPFLG